VYPSILRNLYGSRNQGATQAHIRELKQDTAEMIDLPRENYVRGLIWSHIARIGSDLKRVLNNWIQVYRSPEMLQVYRSLEMLPTVWPSWLFQSSSISVYRA